MHKEVSKPTNIKEASFQHIFDYVTQFLFRQNERSYNEAQRACVYYMQKPDGKECCCAIGALMPDPKLARNEHSSVLNPAVYSIFDLTEKDIFDGIYGYNRANDLGEFLAILQKTHDKYQVVDWHRKFAKVAKEYNLQFI